MDNAEQALVILTPGFPADINDSTCLPAQQSLIRSLNRNFPQLKIIIISFQYPFTNKPYDWNGNRVFPVGGKNKNKLRRLLTWIRSWQILKKIHRNNNVAGIFSFWCTECALVGERFASHYALSHFCWILGQDARMGNHFISWIKPRAETLVAMSPFLAQEFFRNHGILPKKLIPNGIDVLQFPTGSITRDIDILGAGSLIPLKQFDTFISVVEELSQTIPGIKSMLCGDGPERNGLEDKINMLHLSSHIKLGGEKTHEEVLQLMQRTTIFLHTSSYEGFSAVCLEALYAGAHVISFCDPGVGPVDHWHIVKTKDEMVKKAIEILNAPLQDHRPILPFSIEDTAKAVWGLFS